MRLTGLNLNLLIALDVLLETQSVSLAAKRLGRSQSTISGSLQKLRAYFGDDLLVSVGRKMVLTPRGTELAAALKTALLGLEAAVVNSGAFDPTTDNRHFHLITSDYCYEVLLVDLFRRLSRTAPHVSFTISSPGAAVGIERLESGEADALLTVDALVDPSLVRHRLFEDEHAVVAWRENGRCRDGLTEQAFMELGHVVVSFAPNQATYPDLELDRLQRRRRVEISVPSFSDVPLAVVGTDRLGVMYRRHAEKAAATMPLRVHPVPVPLPTMVEDIAYHPMRRTDQGLLWLVSELISDAQRLARPNSP